MLTPVMLLVIVVGLRLSFLNDTHNLSRLLSVSKRIFYRLLITFCPFLIEINLFLVCSRQCSHLSLAYTRSLHKMILPK